MSRAPGPGRTIADVCAEISKGGKVAFAPRAFSRWFNELLRWPPNAFAFTSLVLAESGAYRLAVSPPGGHKWPPRVPRRWNGYLENAGVRYRRWVCAAHARGIPSELVRLGKTLRGSLGVRLSQLCDMDHWSAASAMLELHGIVDEASGGMGIPDYAFGDDAEFLFLYRANRRLVRTGSLAHVDKEVVRVLPKLRTPQTGISLRSLSHNLAIQRGEVEVKWESLEGIPAVDKLNLLLVPHPIQVDASAFKEVEGPLANMNREKFGFFSYAPSQRCDLGWLRALVRAAKERAGRVDGVVMPESALAEDEVKGVEGILWEEQVPLLVAGVRGDRRNVALLAMAWPREPGERGTTDPPGFWREARQSKHHRWCIDQSQIQQYDLGAALHPARRWWEDIEVKHRELRFATTSSGLTICHLICEDLARQDPVAQAVRAVGPTLVLALLLDGPQLKSRWAARYAGVLADDPGSSVLSVTSLGMALRSRPDGAAACRAIAYWRDSRAGQREIHLDPGCTGVLLALCAMEGIEEYAADGRPDGGATTHLVLGGIEQIRDPAGSVSGPQPVAGGVTPSPTPGPVRQDAPAPRVPSIAR